MLVIPDANAGGAILLYDTFNGPNGTALQAHAPIIGGAWTDLVAGLIIESNTLQVQNGPYRYSKNSVGTGYGRVDLEVQWLTTGNPDVVYFGCGFNGASTGIAFEIQTNGSVLCVFDHSPYSANVAAAWTPDTALHTWTIVSVPGQVTYLLDGVQLAQIATGSVPPLGGDVLLQSQVANGGDLLFRSVQFTGL